LRRGFACVIAFNNSDGTLRASLIVLGYSQIRLVDYLEKYSAVIDNCSLTTALNGDSFLNGNLEEHICLKIYVGFDKTEIEKMAKRKI
jgi:hypothetical protein